MNVRFKRDFKSGNTVFPEGTIAEPLFETKGGNIEAFLINGVVYKVSDPYPLDKIRNLVDVITPLSEDRYGPKSPEASPFATQVGGDHYKKYPIQPTVFFHENKVPFAEASAIKYILRHQEKNKRQDLEKAKHYIDLMIEMYYPEK